MNKTKKDIVHIVARIPKDSYEIMKQKAKLADISMNKFFNRAIIIYDPTPKKTS